MGECLLLAVFITYKSSPSFCGTFCYGKNYELVLAKNGLGYILGNFFANSSGHPVPSAAT
jgi:hypothetical protein